MAHNDHNKPTTTSFEDRFKALTGFAYPPKNEDQWNSVLTYAGYSLLECYQVLNTLGYPGYEGTNKLPDAYLSKYANATKDQRLTFGKLPCEAIPLFGPDLLRRLERAAEQDRYRQMLLKELRNPDDTTLRKKQLEPTEQTAENNLVKLRPAARNAYLSFQAIEREEQRKLLDVEAYKLLQEDGIPDDTGANSTLTDYDPPSFATWSRYLRIARKACGDQKYSPRTGRANEKSIVCHAQI